MNGQSPNAIKTIVLDAHLPQLLDNKLFNRELAYQVHHTILPLCYLQEQAVKAGFEFITPDIFLSQPEKYPQAVLISHLTSEFTPQLLAHGARPLILLCMESPYIATKFYLDLRSISQDFKHSFVFSGMRKRLSKRTVYHQMFFPQEFDLQDFQLVPFKERKFSVMISGNKQVSNWRKDLLLKAVYGWRVTNIYKQRLNIIRYFATTGTFDLYGKGWNDTAGLEAYRSDIKMVYHGPVKDKSTVLKNYKFVFCFENSIFPGYVTEKIFDAMFSGVVPIYWGAPDIKNFVPEGCFINVPDFKDFSELDKHMQSLSESDYEGYLVRIKDFLHSEKYFKFSEQSFSKEILSILQS